LLEVRRRAPPNKRRANACRVVESVLYATHPVTSRLASKRGLRQLLTTSETETRATRCLALIQNIVKRLPGLAREPIPQ
jgi:hypothetical protein